MPLLVISILLFVKCNVSYFIKQVVKFHNQMRCFAKFRYAFKEMGFGHGWVKKLCMGLSPGCYVGL